MQDFYHDGQRALQDRFGSRRLADRLADFVRTEFTDDDRSFIGELPYCFLATADAQGRPDVSFKGGLPGFVQVTAPGELALPDYDGNGMFRSLGNIAANPAVALLFVAMHGRPRRLRVTGTARVLPGDPLLASTVGAQLIVRVAVRAIFANCPRYIPAMTLEQPSAYAPRPGQTAPEPAWKAFPEFSAAVPPRHPTFGG